MSKDHSVHFSSDSVEWSTPQELFDHYNKIYQFDLDVCASDQNHKVDNYYTKADNGLEMPWRGVCWMNPPYGREISKWIEKAYMSYKSGSIVVALLPARTDTKYFHSYVYHEAKIEFLKGRVKFIRDDGKTGAAPFPSMVVVWQ